MLHASTTLSAILLLACVAQSALANLGADRSMLPAEHPLRLQVPVAGLDLHADYYRATGQSAQALVVLLHGWHWPDENPLQTMAPFARSFQAAGLDVVVPAMRGWPPTGGVDDCAGRQVADVVQLTERLEGRARPEQLPVFLVGYSQGGQVALLSAARGAAVGATVAYAPVTDMAAWRASTDTHGIRQYLDRECGGRAGWIDRDVVAAAAALVGPILLVHGKEDGRVPPSQSQTLYRVLRQHRADVSLQLGSGSGHSIYDILEPQRAVRFFRRIM